VVTRDPSNMGSGCIDSCPAALPPIPIGQEVGWVQETVWTLQKRENSWSYRDSNSDLSIVHPVASDYTDYAISVTFIILFTNHVSLPLLYSSCLCVYYCMYITRYECCIFNYNLPCFRAFVVIV
jgi:hypothetical protein